jgi:uncharacterized membrane protein YedE/YeeE
MNWAEYQHAILGGLLVGLAAGLVLVLHGRVAGVSGMVGSLFEPRTADSGWRAAFVAGLALGGFLLSLTDPGSVPHPALSPGGLAAAGFVVGFGARMGGGCTSGHGLCGMTLLNRTSILAVLTFMATGVVAVYLGRHVFGVLP